MIFFRLWRKHNSYESTAFICKIGILVLLGCIEYCLFYRKDQEFFFFFWLQRATGSCILVPHSWMESAPPTVEAQSPSH